MNWTCMFCGRENHSPITETVTCWCGNEFTLTMVPTRLMQVEPGERLFTHGRAGYMNRRCRCEVCCAAASEYFRARRKRVA